MIKAHFPGFSLEQDAEEGQGLGLRLCGYELSAVLPASAPHGGSKCALRLGLGPQPRKSREAPSEAPGQAGKAHQGVRSWRGYFKPYEVGERYVLFLSPLVFQAEFLSARLCHKKLSLLQHVVLEREVEMFIAVPCHMTVACGFRLGAVLSGSY